MGRFRRGIRRLLLLWQLLTIILFSALLIPLFLAQAGSAFYTWLTLGTMLLYLLLLSFQSRLKGGLRRYVAGLGDRLFLALLFLALSFLLLKLEGGLLFRTSLVVSAVLYAAAIQKVAFLRVIGL